MSCILLIFAGMSKPKIPLRIFKHQEVIDEYNDMMIRIKAHLFDIKIDEGTFSKPTAEELDYLMFKIMIILKEDNKPMFKHKENT